jgi:hypothetical protein
MKKSNTLFNERRENLFKENIPAFSVQGNSRSVSVFSGFVTPNVYFHNTNEHVT